MVMPWVGKSIWNMGVNIIGGLFGVKKEDRQKYKMHFIMGFEEASKARGQVRPTTPALGQSQIGTLPNLGKYKADKIFYSSGGYDTGYDFSGCGDSLLSRLYGNRLDGLVHDL